jgi:hypothetical protein
LTRLHKIAGQDDALTYPDPFNPSEVLRIVTRSMSRIASLLSFNYSIKGLADGKGAVGLLTEVGVVSGISIFQSGYPLTAFTGASYQPICQNGPSNCPSLANPAIGYAPGSGDFNADGNNLRLS